MCVRMIRLSLVFGFLYGKRRIKAGWFLVVAQLTVVIVLMACAVIFLILMILCEVVSGRVSNAQYNRFWMGAFDAKGFS